MPELTKEELRHVIETRFPDLAAIGHKIIRKLFEKVIAGDQNCLHNLDGRNKVRV